MRSKRRTEQRGRQTEREDRELGRIEEWTRNRFSIPLAGRRPTHNATFSLNRPFCSHGNHFIRTYTYSQGSQLSANRLKNKPIRNTNTTLSVLSSSIEIHLPSMATSLAQTQPNSHLPPSSTACFHTYGILRDHSPSTHLSTTHTQRENKKKRGPDLPAGRLIHIPSSQNRLKEKKGGGRKREEVKRKASREGLGRNEIST